MIKTRRCQVCKGTGYEIEIIEEPCSNCANINPKPNNLCQKCNGKGRVTICHKKQCRACNGKTIIEY